MNRTFLILLMIGVAMLIAVIGQDRPINDLDYLPWEVNRLDNGSIRVFGLTLGKSTIQEANQIYASFAKTRLQDITSANDTHSHQLIAIYDELSIGGIITKIHLGYQLDSEKLAEIFNKLPKNSTVSIDDTEAMLYPLDIKTERSLLNTPVSSITYIPSIDFGEDIIRQRFGQAAEELIISDVKQLWFYPELGLQVYIHADKPDRFVYSSLK